MPKTFSAAKVRQDFLDFFEGKGHEIVPSAPVIPSDDPTLYFTNAGMNQFKDVFLGTGTRPYTRVADTQKCMRVSGKHNDLEDVGHDHSHHTLFEMLGNWSFGDYYKEDAIRWAWELLTEVWGLDPSRLHATVFADPEVDAEDDDEAYQLWKNYVVDEAHITRHGKKDNFWEMGDVGPCGPCTEIHYDLGEEFTSVPGAGPNYDDNRFREIWNLVFIQFERQKNGELVSLPAKHVDTGMGFERIVAILNGTFSNYATDLFTPYLDWVAKESGVGYDESEGGIPHRVIADHLRAISFTIADGVTPSNDHRGYVVRRILRRAARYGRKVGLEKPFLHKMVPLLVDRMGEAFPELPKRKDHIVEVVKDEEERFSVALERGLKLFEKEASEIAKRGETEVSGKATFDLYDTHGFPMDLTRVLAKERGWTIDEEEFDRLREEAKDRSRGDGFQIDDTATKCAEGLPGSEFTGYDTLSGEGEVLRVLPIPDADGEVYLALDRTPCYAESGGQVADRATFSGDGFRGELVHCQKFGDVFVHRVKVQGGELSDGDRITVQVDSAARNRTACNHTATHLLHSALKQVLGDHVNQAGSLVAPDRLRFDFEHSGALTREEIDRVEQIVNEQIRLDTPLEVEVMGMDAAKEKGAMMLFGEKYGSEVRVVEVPGFSTELCGGTHVDRTGRIQAFRFLSQSSVAAKVRRVDCLAGPALVDHLTEQVKVVDELAQGLGCSPGEIPTRVESLQKEIKKLKKDLAAARKKGASLDPGKLASDATEIPGKGFSLASGFAEGLTVPDLRDLSDTVLAKLGKGVVLLATSNEGKVNFVCKVDKALTKDGVHAGNLVREVASVAGGKGGGRPDMATAGGTDPSKIPEALEKAREVLSAP